jgi:hypothetical protein
MKIASPARNCGTAFDTTTWDGINNSKMPLADSPTGDAVMPMVKYDKKEALTFRACYCPNFEGCDGDADFVQAFGMLYYWTIALQDFDAPAAPLNPDTFSYLRVTPQQRVVVKVLCIYMCTMTIDLCVKL